MLKFKKTIFLFMLLLTICSLNLKAQATPARGKVTIDLETALLVVPGDILGGGGGISLGYHFTPRWKLSTELYYLLAGHGDAASSVFPYLTYHPKLRTKKWDLFIGGGVNLVLKNYWEYSGPKAYFQPVLGATWFFTRHVGFTMKIISGFSMGLTIVM